MNQELSTDELKDVTGGTWTVGGNLCKTTGEGNPGNSLNKGNPQWGEICDVGASVKGNNLTDKAKWANRLTLQEHNR
jgi:hypothetical protein